MTNKAFREEIKNTVDIVKTAPVLIIWLLLVIAFYVVQFIVFVVPNYLYKNIFQKFRKNFSKTYLQK